MARCLLPVLLGLLLAVAPATASARPDTAVAAPPSLRQLAKGLVAAGSPGAVVFVRDARGARAGVAGFANLRTRERMRGEHAFRVGSVTKTFVATVVLQLAAEGVLGLGDSVERWLPGLVPNGRAITIRQLLNHTSGIYNYTDDATLINAIAVDRRAVWTPLELVQVATRHPALFPPGAGWSYSNTGYLLLGLVAERATGLALGDQLRRRIFEPLGLGRTTLPSLPTLGAPYAHGYLPADNGLVPAPGGRPVDVTVWNPSWAWAAGAVVSTAGDLARFYGALLRGELLRPQQLQELKTTVPVGGGPEGYGLGITSTTFSCGTAWGHGGSVPGYVTLAYSSDDGSRQAVVMMNIPPFNRPLMNRFETSIGSAFCR